MRDFVQNTARSINIFMADSSGGKTGLTLAIQISKAGAAFGTITPTVTERTGGWYSLAMLAGHVDTLGDLTFHVTATGADASDWTDQVVAYNHADPRRLGLTGIPDADAGTVGGLALTTTAMTLTALERTAIANETETQIIDETDSERVLQAMIDKIAEANPSLQDLTVGAIASAVWANVTRELTAGTNIILSKGTGITGLNDPTPLEISNQVASALAIAHGSESWETPASILTAATRFLTMIQVAGSNYQYTEEALGQIGGFDVGDILVDASNGHNLGIDGLKITEQENGLPVQGAVIRAYLKSEFDSGNVRLKHIAYTGIDGRPTPLMLRSGTYYAVIQHPDSGRPTIKLEMVVA